LEAIEVERDLETCEGTLPKKGDSSSATLPSPVEIQWEEANFISSLFRIASDAALSPVPKKEIWPIPKTKV
jgi:hypothetical protein